MLTRRQRRLRKKRRLVRQAWAACDFPWPESFDKPWVQAKLIGGWGYYDYVRNAIVVYKPIFDAALEGREPQRSATKATILHEAFHAFDYQCLKNEDRAKLVAAIHGGPLHHTVPPDVEHPWGNAQDESQWSNHGHAWWDSSYAESLMEVSADIFVQAFSDLHSQTQRNWAGTHPITPEVEERFRTALLAVVV